MVKRLGYLGLKGGVFILFILFAGLIFSENSTAVSKDSLLAFFTFDNNDLLGDVTSNGRNLTQIGSPTRNNIGKINQTYNLVNGVPFEDKFYISNTLSLGNTASISLWYNQSPNTLDQAITGNGTIPFTINCYKTSNGGFVRVAVGVNVVTSVNTTNGKSISCSNTTQTGTYKFIGVSVDSSHIKLFVGNATNLLNFTGSVGAFPNLNGINGWVIGDSITNLDNGNTNGSIDEYAIWNRTLTTQDFFDLWNNGAGISYRDFTEPVGNFTITAADNFNGTALQIFNATLDNGTILYFGTSTGTINTLVLTNSTSLFNITISADNYANYYYNNFNLSVGSISPELTYYLSRHNITARDNATGSLISSFRIIDDGTFNESTTTNSVIYQHEWNVSSTITINSTGYEEKSHTFNNTAQETFEFNLGQANMFEIRIYDEITDQLITGSTLNVQLISEDDYTNKTTTTGYVNFTLVTPSAYQIRYYDAGELYFTRDYYITLEPNSREILKLFLLNKTYPYVVTSAGVIISVKDTVNTNLENAIVNVNKYFSGSNSYETVERLKTNFEGESLSYLTSDEFYRFVVEYNNETVLSTSATKIFDTSISLIVDLVSNPVENFNKWFSLEYLLSFSYASDTFTLTFNDPSFVTESVCLDVFERRYSGDVLYNSSCSSSQSGTLLVGVAEVNGTTYIAKASANIIGSSTHLLTIKEIKYALSHAFDSGNNGVGFIIMLTLVFAFIGIWSPVVALILTPIPLLIGTFVGLINIPIAVAGAVFVAFFVMVIFIGRRV